MGVPRDSEPAGVDTEVSAQGTGVMAVAMSYPMSLTSPREGKVRHLQRSFSTRSRLKAAADRDRGTFEEATLCRSPSLVFQNKNHSRSICSFWTMIGRRQMKH